MHQKVQEMRPKKAIMNMILLRSNKETKERNERHAPCDGERLICYAQNNH